jgi:hypothetical protein
MHAVEDVWLDRCEISDTGDSALTLNTNDAARVHITFNHIHHTNGYGEGMYLGANHAAAVLSDSVIARNHVHDTRGLQGDGIELKQGSYNNRISHNAVHDTNYPCLLVYGTGSNAINVVEGNVLVGANDNVLQVQGEALVQNNLIMNGATGFHSHDHQGLTRDLTFVHNTIVNPGRAAYLPSWNNRPGMLFCNNVVYSESDVSIGFPAGATGVTIQGNVVVGPTWGVPLAGFVTGNGLQDFANVQWNGARSDATPVPGGPIGGAGAPEFAVPADKNGAPQTAPPAAGCLVGP